MNEGYNVYTNRYQNLSSSFPVAMSSVEMLSPLLQSMGIDVMPWLDILRYNRADRPFHEMDYGVSMSMRNQFRSLTQDGPTTSNLQSVGRAFASYFMNDKGMAESSLGMVSPWATSYAFGTGGGSMGDLMPGWNPSTMGKYTDQLTRYMADIYNFDLSDSVTNGQRSVIAAGMTRANPGLLQDYASMKSLGEELKTATSDSDYVKRRNEDWVSYNRRIRNKVTDEYESGEVGPWSRLKDELVRLTDRMARAQQQLDKFGDAADSWGKVLKTDAQNAMQKVSNMLGGDVYSIFSGDAQTLKDIPISLQHTGALTGRGFDHMRAVANQVGQYMQATGGPLAATLNVANESMIQSTGGSRYWMTQEGVDKMFTQYNADLWNTDAGNIARGAAQYYTEYKLRNLRPGQTFNQQDTIREIDNILASTGGDVSVRNVNRALSRATGQQVSLGIGDFEMLGQGSYAKDYMAGRNEFIPIVREQGQRELVNMIFAAQGSDMTYDSLYRMNDAILGRNRDVLELTQKNGYDLSQEGLSRQQMNFVQSVNRMMQFGTVNMQTNNPEVLGSLGVRNPMEVMRFSSRTARQRENALRWQRDTRTYLSSMTKGGDMLHAMSNLVQNNPDFSIGDLLSVGGTSDLDGRSLDALANLKMDKENTQEFAETLKTLGNRTNSSETRAYVRHLMTEANKIVQKDPENLDLRGIANVLSPLGIMYNAEKNALEAMPLDNKQVHGEIKKFTDAKKEWVRENKEEDEKRKTILNMYGPKGDASKMTWSEKKEASKHLIARELAKTEVKLSDFKDPERRKKHYEYREALEKGDKTKADKLYNEIKDDFINAKGYSEKKEKIEGEMGISYDKSDIGSVIMNTLYEVGQTFMKAFTDGTAIRVTQKPVEQQ